MVAVKSCILWCEKNISNLHFNLCTYSDRHFIILTCGEGLQYCNYRSRMSYLVKPGLILVIFM